MSKYQQYYTSSDCTVFVEDGQGKAQPVLLDKLRTVAFSERLTSEPVYGIGNSRYGFVSQGNLIINGVLEFNFSHPNYLAQTLAFIEKGGQETADFQEDLDFTALSLQSDEQLTQAKQKLARKIQRKYANSIHKYPQNFTLRIVLNNGFMYKEDKDKVFLLRGVKILGNELPISTSSDDPLVQAYAFVAREVSKESLEIYEQRVKK